MIALWAALLLTQVPATPKGATVAARERVFFAQLEGGGAVSKDELELLSEAVVVEARRHSDRFEIIGKSDVQQLLDVEAGRLAMGCDSSSCATEVADALGAPQVLTGKIGRLGDTWVLTLTRIERAHMRVLDSAKVERDGAHPDVLLRALPDAVSQVLEHGVSAGRAPPAPPASVPWMALGVGAGAVGGGALIGAGGLYLLARQQLEDGLTKQSLDERQQFKARGEPLYYGSMAALGVGGAAALTAGVFVAVAVLGGE